MPTMRLMSLVRDRRQCLFGSSRVWLRKVAHACYVFVPLPTKWKDRVARVLYSAMGWIFKGDTNYEIWKSRSRARRIAVEIAPIRDDQIENVLKSIEFPPTPNPVVSIVIPALGCFKQTLACLRSIHAHLPKAPVEVIVADTANGVPEIRRLQQIRGLRLLTGEIGADDLGSCDSLDRQWRGQYLHFLGSDTEVTPGWLDSMLELFSTQPLCGMVGSMLLRPNGRLEAAGGVVRRDGQAEHFGQSDAPTRSIYNYVREVDYCPATSLLIPSALFERLRGVGAGLVRADRKDTELSFRVREGGKRVLYQPLSRVVHQWDFSPATRNAEHGDRYVDVLRGQDRPCSREMILVVDQYTPQPDRDAGSRSMWCILRTLVKMDLVVKFWPQNQSYDPDYADWLQQAGIEVLVGEQVRNNFGGWLAANQDRLKFVLLSRPSVAQEFLPLVRERSRAKVLFYGHDVHHQRLFREHTLTGSRTARREAESFRKMEHSMWRAADVVYYPSSVETEMVRAAVPGVRALTMPLYFYDDMALIEGPESRKGILFVAGFGHPPNVDAAKWLVHSILPLIRAKASVDAHLWLAGSNPADEVRRLAGNHVTVTGYVTDERLAELYRTTRVAIVPLRFGAGMKGKVIEALHHGIPLVTTPVGAEGLEGLESIVPVSTHEDTLAEQVCALLQDDQRWRALSGRQGEYVSNRFSAEVMERALRAGLADDRIQQESRFSQDAASE